MTYDEFLTKRLYTSTIIKETNMYDRAIYEYKRAKYQLLEADRIKNDIRYLKVIFGSILNLSTYLNKVPLGLFL